MMSTNRQPADFSFAEQGRVREERKNAWHGPASLLLAAVIHIVLLVQLGSLIKPDAGTPHRDALLEVELVTTAMAAEAPKAVEPAPAPEKPEPVAELPVEKPEPVALKKPVKQTRNVARPSPAEPKPAHIVRQPAAKPAQPSAPVITQQAAPSRDRIAEQNRIKLLRRQYLTRIMAELEAHKRYPYSARRRHLQGNIDISFMIDPSGQISDVQISGGSNVLRTSSMEALQASRPVPPLPKELITPIRCHCIMQYQLER